MAITLAQNLGVGSGGNPPGSGALGSSVPIGHVLVVLFYTVGSQGNALSATVSDNVNSGNYNQISLFFDGTNGINLGIFWKVSNAVGIPTASITLGANQFGGIYLADFAGFVGIPTLDSALTAHNGGNSTALTVPCTNGFSNELTIGVSFNTGGNGNMPGGGPPGWHADDVTGFTRMIGWQYQSSALVSNPFAATLTSSDPWDVLVGGIYDQPLGATWIKAPMGPGLQLPFNPTQFSGRFGGPGFPYATQNPPSGQIWGRHISHSRHRRN